MILTFDDCTPKTLYKPRDAYYQIKRETLYKASLHVAAISE